MNAKRLLAHFERISEAPDAIVRLRRFILDLAVRGKLLEQDPEDEPAEELLASITAEKRYLEKLGEIRASKKIPDPEEPPFGIPMTWAWTQLACIGSLSPRNLAPDSCSVSFVPMPLISSEYGVPNGHEVRPWGEIKKGYTHFAEGDVGLAKITPCFENGKSTVFRSLAGGIGSGTTELHIIRPLQVSPDFILLFLKSSHFVQTGIPRMTGTAGQKRVPLDYFAHSPFPLPPLAEQHRIVAKVDELMAICDQLEAARNQRQHGRERLLSATLQRLNQPAEDPASFRKDASFALQVLPSLTTTPVQIKQLRQTILNLAVRGKLVEQDPEDEPADDLLATISFERVDSVQSRKMKSSRPVAPYDGDGEYELPCGWTWSQLGSITAVEDGAMCDGPFGSKLKTEHYISEPGFAVVRLGNIGIGEFLWGKEGHITSEHFESLPGNHIRPGDLLIAGLADPLVRCCEAPANLGPAVNKADCFRLRLHRLINRFFVCHYLNSPVAKSFAAEENHGMTRERINLGNAKSIPIPLPPLAEQHRIVAKVDELMALCDQLEQQLSQADQQRRRLLEAVLAEALVEPERALNSVGGS